MNKGLMLGVCVFVFTAIGQFVWADVPESQQKEVQHLLQYVRSSKCEMERNGTRHQGEKAVSHIQWKYEYYKNKIKTTEEFIGYAATKSTMSGKRYLVHCPGREPMFSADWLWEELQRFRKSNQNGSEMDLKRKRHVQPNS